MSKPIKREIRKALTQITHKSLTTSNSLCWARDNGSSCVYIRHNDIGIKVFCKYRRKPGTIHDEWRLLKQLHKKYPDIIARPYAIGKMPYRINQWREGRYMAWVEEVYYIAMEHVDGYDFEEYARMYQVDSCMLIYALQIDHPIFNEYDFHDTHGYNFRISKNGDKLTIIDLDPRYIEKISA